MPQLMPLNWMFSGTSIVILVVLMGLLYSVSMKMLKVEEKNFKGKTENKMKWCW